MVEMYGPERLLVNSAGDWGPSKPTAVPDFILDHAQCGHAESLIRRIVYENPLKFFSQSRNFEFTPPDSELGWNNSWPRHAKQLPTSGLQISSSAPAPVLVVRPPATPAINWQFRRPDEPQKVARQSLFCLDFPDPIKHTDLLF